MNSICSGPVAVMAYSSSPPGSSSSLLTSTVNPSGAHHDSIPAFVVHSSQTSSTGAGYVRSSLIPAASGMARVSAREAS